jgi:hypothetical protein
MPVLASAQNVLTELPTAFAMTGAVYFAFRAADTQHSAFAVVAGALAGWAGLLRVVPLADLIPAMAALLWLTPGLRGRRKLILIGVCTGAAITVVLIPMVWYGSKGGGYRLSRSTGYHLFNRAIFDQKLFEPNGPATRRLIGLMPDRDFRNSWNWEVSDDPRVQHIPWDELELLVRQCAMEAIRANTGAFVAYTPRLAWKLYSVPTGWLPQWGGTAVAHPLFERAPLLPVTKAGFAWNEFADRVNQRVWPVACWMAALAFFLYLRHPERRIAVAMTLATGLYLLASATVAVFAARYNAPVVPMTYALAAMASYGIVQRVVVLAQRYETSRETPR